MFPKNLLTANCLNKENLFQIFKKAQMYEENYKHGVKFNDLEGKSVVLAFFENSTRTRNSFEVSAKRLSAEILTFSAISSSLAKGESLADTIRTIDALFDCSNNHRVNDARSTVLWVIRNQYAGVPKFVQNITSNIIINAGDGKHEHPTQAILDAYTILKHYQKFEGLNVGIIGDILNSRVARSNITTLQTLGANVNLFGPGTLLPQHMDCWNTTRSKTINEIIEWADAIILLRLQNERMDSGLLPSMNEYRKFYQVNVENWTKKDKIIILHPGPVNYNVELDHKVSKLRNSMIDKQVTNGVFTRMATMALLANGI